MLERGNTDYGSTKHNSIDKTELMKAVAGGDMR